MKTGRLFRYTTLPPLLHLLSKRELTLLPYSSWEDKNDVSFLEEYSRRTGTHGYALCLTHADETFHHWKVYSKGDAGVRITFDKSDLVAWAQGIPGMRAEDVEYMTIEQKRAAPPATEKLPFIKRYPYRGEEEVRLFYANTHRPEEPPSFPLDLNLIRRITLSPWLPKSLRDAVAGAINEVAVEPAIQISRSTLVDNDEWKNLAEGDA